MSGKMCRENSDEGNEVDDRDRHRRTIQSDSVHSSTSK